MPQKLELSSNIVLRSEPQYYGTYAAFDYKRVTTEYLTEEEYRILNCLYSRPSSSDELSEELHIDRKRCEKFIRRMVKLGYVRHSGASCPVTPPRIRYDNELFKGSAIPFLSAPTSVDIFVTSRCNLNCIHCFADGNLGNSRELNVNDLKSIFNQLESMGVFEVRINGGEPLLHRDIKEILAFLREKRFRKVMLTNGTLLNDKIVKLLKESGTIPTISLDDSRKEDHDSFRGVRGAFDKTVEALQLLKHHGVEFGINCCINKSNMARCEEIITLAEKMGARRIAFLDLKPAGRMKSNPSVIPSYNEYEAVMAGLSIAKAMHRKTDVALDTFLHCYPLRESILEARKGFVSCLAGKTRLTIDSDGFIYPCNLVIGDSNWRMGNVKNESIMDIWFSSKWGFFRGGVKVQNLTKCRTCKKMAKCKDFYCRLLPYVSTGNLFGPHPKCG
jgi:radical SAM protein with 4Fe4S-binding SPASM domain